MARYQDAQGRWQIEKVLRDVATNYTHQDGRLWSREVQVSALGFPSRPTVNMEANTGDRRVPAWDLVDIRVEKDIRFTDTTRAGVFIDFLNLTNSDATQSVTLQRKKSERPVRRSHDENPLPIMD